VRLSLSGLQDAPLRVPPGDRVQPENLGVYSYRRIADRSRVVPMAAVDRARTREIEQLFDELMTLSRNHVARVRRATGPLSFVEHSLLTFIRDTPGCRATDIAQAHGLNRSTVSRQVAELVEAEVAEYAPGTGRAGRGQVLQLTDRGWAALGQSVAFHRPAAMKRLTEWTFDEIEQFRRLLNKYNRLDAAAF